MITKDKVLKLCVPIESKAQEEEDGSLRITGHASTNDEDRSGDIIVSDAWKKSGALDNYLKNPVVLAYHDMSRPIGKTISHEVDSQGLKITAKISKAAGDILDLIKEGILSAFSVGFMIRDADWDTESGIFIIKELELYEVSVVSVPANQNALFSIEKNFSSAEEYKEFKEQFSKSKSEETLMDKPKETPAVDVADLVSQITARIKSDLEAERKNKEEIERKAKEDAEKVAVAATTAAERLIGDLRKELEEKDSKLGEALAGLGDQVKKLADNGDIRDVFSSEQKDNKMKYADTQIIKFDDLDFNTKSGMIYAARVQGCDITETKTFKDLVKKSNMEHWDAGVTGEWEDEYSTKIQNAMREQLVVEPLFTTIPMTTPTLNMPINPEAGDATWVHSAAYRSSRNPADETGDGTDTSTGEAVNHQLDEQVLIAYKLATREYIGYEEEEDSIVALAPVINDAVARRMARTSDLAFLRGTGVLSNTASFNPIVGLENRGANTTDITVAGGAAWRTNIAENDFADMRRNLGIYGLDPSKLVFVVSHDVYYEMMKFNNFKTVDTYGPMATLHTGEVGKIFGVKVLVSQQFNNAAITTGTVGTTLAVLVRPDNFLKGELRGITTEADRDVINQKRVIVSSRRFAFNDIITGEATVNLEIAS